MRNYAIIAAILQHIRDFSSGLVKSIKITSNSHQYRWKYTNFKAAEGENRGSRSFQLDITENTRFFFIDSTITVINVTSIRWALCYEYDSPSISRDTIYLLRSSNSCSLGFLLLKREKVRESYHFNFRENHSIFSADLSNLTYLRMFLSVLRQISDFFGK